MAFDFGDLAGVGVGAATGNWVGAAISAVGLGMSIFGGSSQASDSKAAAAALNTNQQQQSRVNIDEANQEQSISDQKQQAMELQGRRQSLEVIRQTQQAQALALSRGTNQGAQFGSGLKGGQAQVTDEGTFNLGGIQQSLAFGRNIADYNRNISNDRINMFGLQSTEASIKSTLASNTATDQGLQSLGGAVMKAGPVIGQFAQGFGKSTSGNYSGTPGASNTGGLY